MCKQGIAHKVVRNVSGPTANEIRRY